MGFHAYPPYSIGDTVLIVETLEVVRVSEVPPKYIHAKSVRRCRVVAADNPVGHAFHCPVDDRIYSPARHIAYGNMDEVLMVHPKIGGN